MKILILSASHPFKTAGIVAHDLYRGLREIEGNEVKMVVRAWDKYPDKNIKPIDTAFQAYLRRLLDISQRVLKKLRKVFFGFKAHYEPKIKTNPDYLVQDYDQTTNYIKTKKILKRAGFFPDIILVLFMPTFISFRNLHEIYKLTGAPIYLYLMDMAPFTGGCHYAWDCLGYTEECGNCPALYSNNQNDQTHVNYNFKKKYAEKTNIIPIAASEWQFMQLSKGSLFINKRKFKVLLPVNENQYCSYDKIKARQELGLPIFKKIIFFGAVSITEIRKGLNILIEALNILSQKVENLSMIHLAIAGNNGAFIKDLLPFSYTLLGHLEHNRLPRAFQAADVFVSPSIEDSGPMMVNQSIMCGTPVVSFEMGVALDLVHNGETGYKAKLKDANDLVNGIKYILELKDLEYKKMSLTCRETGIRLCGHKKKVKEWMEIFINQLQ